MKRYQQQWFVTLGVFTLLFASTIACGAPLAPAPPAEPPQVTEEPSKKPAVFEIESLTISPSGIMVGDSAIVTATVRNVGDIAGSYTASLLLDGQELESRDVLVPPRQSRSVRFDVTKTVAGSYELTVADSSAVLTVYDWHPYLIQYDEGEPLNWLSMIYTSGEWGLITHFTPPTKPYVIKNIVMCAQAVVKDHAEWESRYFTVRIWDKDKNRQLWTEDFSWRLFQGFANWQDLKVPDIRVEDDFHVEVLTRSDPPPASNYLGLYYWKAKGEGRSGYSHKGMLVEDPREKMQNLNWAIRIKGEGAPTLLAYDDGKADAMYWTPTKSYLVHFSLTAPAFELQRITIYGIAEVEGCEGRNFTVKVWHKSSGRQLWAQDFPWKLFAGGKWVELPVPDIVCPSDFCIELTTNSSEACRLYIGHDSSVPNRHSYMSIDGKIIPWQPWVYKDIEYTREKVNWMIRAGGRYR